jgi:hypothetical protein
MQRMALRFVLALVLVAACKRDLTSELTELETRACDCAAKKDKACGKGVLADLGKLRDAKNVKADEQKAAAAAKKIAVCLLESGVTGLEIHEVINKVEPAPTP